MEKVKYKLVDPDGYFNSSSFNKTLWTRFSKNGFYEGFISSGYLSIADELDKTWCLIGPSEFKYFEEVKEISPDDEVTITTTYRDLAKAYLVLGKSNGSSSRIFKEAYKLWDDKVDPILAREIRNMLEMDCCGTIQYNAVEKDWIDLLFSTEDKKEDKIKESFKKAHAILEELERDYDSENKCN